MRTTKMVVLELDPGDVVEVVARVKEQDGSNYRRAAARLEFDEDLGHQQLRVDIGGQGQANVLNHARGSDARDDDSDELDEVFFNKGISIFL